MMTDSPPLLLEGVYFNCSDPDAVKIFIDRHAFLTRTLCKIPSKIREIFDEDVDIVLEPEWSGADVSKVWVLIQTDMNRSKAFKKLKILDQHWWIDMSHRCRDYLDIDLL